MTSQPSSMNKLFKWEGIKKELFWIFFILFILFIGWAYKTETDSCKEIQKTECYQQCSFNEGVRIMQEENPELGFMCNYTTRSCAVSGVPSPNFKGGFNITFERGDSNNTF